MGEIIIALLCAVIIIVLVLRHEMCDDLEYTPELLPPRARQISEEVDELANRYKKHNMHGYLMMAGQRAIERGHEKTFIECVDTMYCAGPGWNTFARGRRYVSSDIFDQFVRNKKQRVIESLQNYLKTQNEIQQ